MSAKPMTATVLRCGHALLHLAPVIGGERVGVLVELDAADGVVRVRREDGGLIETITSGERIAWAAEAFRLLGTIVEFVRGEQPSCAACGFVAGDLSPKSVEYHRAHRAAHLDKFPDIDAGTRAALDLMVALAEKHEQANGPVVS